MYAVEKTFSTNQDGYCQHTSQANRFKCQQTVSQNSVSSKYSASLFSNDVYEAQYSGSQSSMIAIFSPSIGYATSRWSSTPRKSSSSVGVTRTSRISSVRTLFVGSPSCNQLDFRRLLIKRFSGAILYVLKLAWTTRCCRLGMYFESG